MTTRQVDKIIQAGKPVMVRGDHGEPFLLTIESRDRRMVRGTYLWEGKILDGTFYRDELKID